MTIKKEYFAREPGGREEETFTGGTYSVPGWKETRQYLDSLDRLPLPSDEFVKNAIAETRRQLYNH